MSTSKQETGQAPQSSTSGSERGCGIRGRQHDSQRNSPTSSRRPPQAFYTPGAFSKQRKYPENQTARLAESPGKVRNNTKKSITETKPLKGNHKINMSLEQDNKSDSSSQLNCKPESKHNRNKKPNITDNINTIEHSLDKVHVSSAATYSVQSTLETGNQENKGRPIAGCIGKEIDDDTIMVHDSDSTSIHVTNSLPSNNSTEKLIYHCSDNNIHSKLDDENYKNQEDVSAESSTLHIENTCDDENIQSNNGKTSGCESTKKNIEINMLTVDCKESATYFAEQSDLKSCPKDKSVSKNTNEKKNDAKEKERNPKPGTDYAVDRFIEHCASKVKSMAEETDSNMDQDAIESNVKVSDDVILFSKSSAVVREDASEPSETSSNLKDEDEVENNESIVDSVNKEKFEVQSKSKRQYKKEVKAKKKEEKMKKKQMKPKSKKTTKKCDGDEKAAGEEDKVDDLGEKRKINRLTKTRQGKEDMMPDDKVKKKDKCQNSSPVGHIVNQEGAGSKMENEKDSAEEEDWETQWGDDGECLDEDHLAELNEQLDTTSLQIVKPQFDYLSFKPNDIILENGVFDHVLEIYDFSPEFKDRDLYSCLSNFREQGIKIHWVDDTHALAAFCNHRTAKQAIEQCCSPMLKLRPLYDGTQNSKLKAKRDIDVLQPYKERPKTTKLVANRLVTGALGMQSKMSREEKQLEAEKIKAERERKKDKQKKEKQKKDLWESNHQ